MLLPQDKHIYKMTNYEILTLLQTTRKEMSQLDRFVADIRRLAYRKDNVIEALVEISRFDNTQPTYLASLQNELNQVRSELADFSARQFFESAFALTTILRNLLVGLKDAERPATKLLQELNHLQDSFDDYARQHSQKRAANVLMHADAFIEKLDAFDEYIDFISAALSSDQEPPDESGIFSLYMPAALTFDEFISRLSSIKIIYDELCQIVDVSASDEPLSIVKVESGSLWAKLFGNSKVMALMDDLLRGAANFIHRNYTKEGKLATIPSSLEAMDELLKFSKKLEASGVNVDQIHDQLAKGTLIIAKNMNSLFQDQSSVVINGETIELADERKKKLLESRSVPRLENGNQDD